MLAANDWRCSPSFSLQTQQRRSWPPVATMDEPSAMQLIDEGEATHSCWRAAIVLLRGSLPRTGVATTRIGRCNATTPEHGAAVGARTKTWNSSMYRHASSSSWPPPLKLPVFAALRREEQQLSSLDQRGSLRKSPARSPTLVADLGPPSAPEPIPVTRRGYSSTTSSKVPVPTRRG